MSTKLHQKQPASGLRRLVTFKTRLGWVGFSHSDGVIQQLKFGISRESQLKSFFDKPLEKATKLKAFEKRMVAKLEQFSVGKRVSFESIDVDESWMTPFQKAVTNACRGIEYGETASYGQLAQVAGSPRAARAVGSVMSRNPYPLIVPCHRVVSSVGLGGFSAPRGTSMKLKLLKMEGAKNFA